MKFANELKPPLGEALEHYGVKGMRWGVRRTPEQLGRARAKKKEKAKVKQTKANQPKKQSKRQVRKEAREKAYKDRVKRGEQVIEEALNNPNHLFVIQTGRSAATVATGREFVQFLSKGGAFDPLGTAVWEMQPKNIDPWKS